MKLSVRYHLKHYKVDGVPKTVPVPIIAKITKSARERFEVDADERILPADWDFERQRATRRDPSAILINKHLAEYESWVVDLYRENRDKSWQEFKALVQGKPLATDEKKSQFFPALDKFIESYKQEKSPLTPKNYEALKTHLQGMESVTFEGMDFNFLDSLRHTLRKLEVSTVNKYVARLKTFLSWATDRGYPVNQVYRKWRIVKRRRKEPFFITEQQIQALDKAKLSGHAAIGRAAFMILAGTGARISDGKRLTKASLTQTMHGLIWNYSWKKGSNTTLTRVTVPFNWFLGELALKYLNQSGDKFPDYSEQQLNGWVKEAFKGIIPDHTQVHLHIGRSTYISIALHYMVPDIVMTATGISDYKTIRYYKGRTDTTIMQQQFAQVEAKMKAG